LVEKKLRDPGLEIVIDLCEMELFTPKVGNFLVSIDPAPDRPLQLF
jgi:hypothetical protein